jgi:hypothetical protein
MSGGDTISIYYGVGDQVDYTGVTGFQESPNGTLTFTGKRGTTGPRGKWTIRPGYTAYVIWSKDQEPRKVLDI